MRLSNRLPGILAAAISLVVIAGACTTPNPAPRPIATVTSLATVERTAILPGETPALVAFPTVTAVPTAPAETATLSAPVPTPSGRPSSGMPVIQVVSPVTNTQISVNQTIYVIAFAASDSAIARIELTDDNTPVRSETAPSAVTTMSALIPWTPNQLGSHVLRAIAFDANNVPSNPEEVIVNVTPDTRRPTANIVFPIGTPQVELGTNLQLYAVATDEVGITQFELWVDNQIYTYIRPPGGPASPSLPGVFAWNALAAGNHNLFVRARDTQGQTTDSPPLKVFVTDTHSPTLNLSIDRTNLPVGEPMTITITAVDVSGIQRIELWTGKEISSTTVSTSPTRQTSMTTQFQWQSGNPGDYTVMARTYNASGNLKESPAQIVSVLRPGQATPTRAPTSTPTRTRAPRAQPTARLQPPPPPTVEISQPSDHFANLWPVRVTFTGRGSAELDRIELWGYYQGQLNPQVICTIDARASTQKAGQCDWSPTDAGIVYLYAQAIDIYDQLSRSATISGYIGVPAIPTPMPPPVSLAGRWTATTATGQYTATFRPIVTASGTALRGDFKVSTTVTPTMETNGRIASGTAKSDRVTFRVEFNPAGTATPTATLVPDTPAPTTAPTAAPTSVPTLPALDFDCGVDPAGTTLDCKFKDSRGQNGTAMFKRDTSP